MEGPPAPGWAGRTGRASHERGRAARRGETGPARPGPGYTQPPTPALPEPAAQAVWPRAGLRVPPKRGTCPGRMRDTGRPSCAERPARAPAPPNSSMHGDTSSRPSTSRTPPGRTGWPRRTAGSCGSPPGPRTTTHERAGRAARRRARSPATRTARRTCPSWRRTRWTTFISVDPVRLRPLAAHRGSIAKPRGMAKPPAGRTEKSAHGARAPHGLCGTVSARAARRRAGASLRARAGRCFRHCRRRAARTGRRPSIAPALRPRAGARPVPPCRLASRIRRALGKGPAAFRRRTAPAHSRSRSGRPRRSIDHGSADEHQIRCRGASAWRSRRPPTRKP